MLTSDQKQILLYICSNGETSGRKLRHILNEKYKHWWQKWSGPGFYAMMARLVDDGWLKENIVDLKLKGINVKEWTYKATDKLMNDDWVHICFIDDAKVGE